MSDLIYAKLAAAAYNPTPAHGVQRITFQDISADITGNTIAVRGTNSFATLRRDMLITGTMCVTHPDLGACQAGALAAALGLLPLIPATVDTATGHSEGGGIATLLAALLGLRRLVIWDGVRAGGDGLIAALGALECRAYRFAGSPVTDWPFGYQHVRPLVEIGDWCLDPVEAHSINRAVGWLEARKEDHIADTGKMVAIGS